MDNGRGCGCLVAIVGLFCALFMCLGLALCTGGSGSTASASGSGQALADVAKQEYDNKQGYDDGLKYNNWYGERAAWCAMFVSWCADQCGLIDDGTLIKSAMAMDFAAKDYGQENHKTAEMASGKDPYVPQPGDLLVRRIAVDSHVAIVYSYDPKTKHITHIGGNESDTIKMGDIGTPAECGFEYIVHPNYQTSGVEDSGGGKGDGTKKQLFAGKVDYSMSQAAFVNKWGTAIDKWYKNKMGNPPLTGTGRIYAEAAYKYKLDPRYLPTVSIQESGGGRHCFHPHNAWGYGQYSWSDWRTPIFQISKCIATSSTYKKLNTIEKIQNTYSPPSENDTASYIKNCKKQAAQITRYAK